MVEQCYNLRLNLDPSREFVTKVPIIADRASNSSSIFPCRL